VGSALRRRRQTRAAVLGVGLVGTVAFGYLALRGIHWHQVWVALRTSNYWWAIPAVAVLVLSVLVRAARWRLLFRRERRPGLPNLTASLFVCHFFNVILPARAGEIARIVDLNRRERTPMAETSATVVLERIYDILALLVLLFVLVPWLPHISWLLAAGVLAAVLVAAAGALVVVVSVYGERAIRWIVRPLRRLPFAAERIEGAPTNIAHGLAGIRNWRLALGVFVWSAASWVVIGVAFWLMSLGFDLRVGLLAGIFVAIATTLAQIIPSLPASLGVFEAATVVALRAYHVTDAKALSYALVLHALNALTLLVVGGTILAAEPRAARRRLVSSV
jgi:glycosyltransferase 2 family protein